MIVKRKVDVEELEQAAADMCKWYCRFPLIWDEQVMGHELSESELCKSCPMSELMKGAIIDNCPTNQNGWQE